MFCATCLRICQEPIQKELVFTPLDKQRNKRGQLVSILMQIPFLL